MLTDFYALRSSGEMKAIDEMTREELLEVVRDLLGDVDALRHSARRERDMLLELLA